jgi:phenylpropionate dioxygenase-like ring-hydroxylating dioxygenase large terminal subunit
MAKTRTEWLVDTDRGLVGREVFSDEAIYRQELERIFARCWLCLGHESLIPNPGDYYTTFMGEDPIIVCRDGGGRVRAFLNSCRHRGNKVCLFDRGNTNTFTCSYHGWAYSPEGKLTGVPFFREAYLEQLDREPWGLVPVTHLEIYGGLIFGAWDAFTSLDDYLGDMRWYLDHIVLVPEVGGLEWLPQRYSHTARGNWKIMAENFAGDHYHTFTTHGSYYKLGMAPASLGYEAEQARSGPFEVAAPPAHGLGGIYTSTAPYERDLAGAAKMGPEVVEYVEERYRRKMEQLAPVKAKPYQTSHGNVFPTLTWSGTGGPLDHRAFYILHPKGPLETDVWLWLAVERDAPEAVKARARQDFSQRGQLSAGFFAQDDSENFERVTESTRTLIARRYPFYYGMSREHEGHWPGQEEWEIAGMPGTVGPRFSEHAQRQFYRFWHRLMTDGGR